MKKKINSIIMYVIQFKIHKRHFKKNSKLDITNAHYVNNKKLKNCIINKLANNANKECFSIV